MNIHFSDEEDYNSDISDDLDFYTEDKIGTAESITDKKKD